MGTASALLMIAREAKRSSGLTHKDLGQALHCHQITSTNRLRGANPMTIDQLSEHLSACGKTTEWVGRALLSASGATGGFDMVERVVCSAVNKAIRSGIGGSNV